MANRDALWVEELSGTKEPCISGVHIPLWYWAIFEGRKGQPIVNYRDQYAVWVMDSGGAKEALHRTQIPHAKVKLLGERTSRARLTTVTRP